MKRKIGIKQRKMNKSADDTIIIDDIGGLPHVKGFLQLYVPYTMIHMISTIIGTLGAQNIYDILQISFFERLK